MRIGQADAEVIKPTGINHEPQFSNLCNSHLRQKIESVQSPDAIPQRSQRQFGNNPGMDYNSPIVQGLL